MHPETFDDMNPMDRPDDWGLDLNEVRKHLEEEDTGKWDWDKIDCCFTGKDADLEAWGDQGLQLLSCNEDGVAFAAHALKTFVGTEVCLNVPPEIENDDAAYDAALEAYLDAAQEVISGCPGSGEWDGDSWVFSLHEEAVVPWVYKDDGVTPDYKKTADACISKARELLQPWESSVTRIDTEISQIAGWIDGDGNHIKAGYPAPLAAWASTKEF